MAQSTKKKKSQTKKEWEKFLKPHDKFILVNEDDPDLKPIRISLPDPPPLEGIDGYDKPPVHQYFRRPEVPHKLLELQNRCETAEECVAELRANPKFYADEIAYIQREWKRRREGYWFFNNGKPTYIPGVHYFYLCYWFLSGKRPEYRSRDRKFFLFAVMCLQDPFCAGFNYPKFRREGATSKASCFEYWLITMERNVRAGNQSKDGESSKEIFTEHLVPSHRRMPFWFRPVFSGKDDPKSSLDFFAPASTVTKKGASLKRAEALESSIDFGTSTEGFYDRAKLRIHYSDECGKTIEADVYKRHNLIKPTIMEGNKFIGMIINTSTVGEMTKDGGANFQKISKGSMYHERLDNNETATGLYNLFIPAYDGFDFVDKKTGERFIDKYGESDKNKVKAYLESVRQGYLDKGDLEGYNEFVRMFPMTYRECFRIAAGACKFNVEILESVLEKYRFGNPYLVRGNFRWKDNKPDTTVEWHPTSNGKFLASYIPDNNNKQLNVGGIKIPAFKHLFSSGGDPFKFNTTKGTASEISKGGGAVFRKFDPAVDNENAPKKEWKTHKFCCTYLHRPPTKNEYEEDMLMMCVFYSCQMNAERNVSDLIEHFIERGYEGYLYHKYDVKTGKREKEAGNYTVTKTQESIFGDYYNYIEEHGRWEVHDEIFRQCREIQDDMSPFDLFVAGGHALMAARADEFAPKPVTVDIKIHRKRTYA